MYFLLKRLKGGITYSDFMELPLMHLFELYNRELELAEEESKALKQDNNDSVRYDGNRKIQRVPDPEVEEDPKAVELVNDILGI